VVGGACLTVCFQEERSHGTIANGMPNLDDSIGMLQAGELYLSVEQVVARYAVEIVIGE